MKLVIYLAAAGSVVQHRVHTAVAVVPVAVPHEASLAAGRAAADLLLSAGIAAGPWTLAVAAAAVSARAL